MKTDPKAMAEGLRALTAEIERILPEVHPNTGKLFIHCIDQQSRAAALIEAQAECVEALRAVDRETVIDTEPSGFESPYLPRGALAQARDALAKLDALGGAP